MCKCISGILCAFLYRGHTCLFVCMCACTFQLCVRDSIIIQTSNTKNTNLQENPHDNIQNSHFFHSEKKRAIIFSVFFPCLSLPIMAPVIFQDNQISIHLSRRHSSLSSSHCSFKVAPLARQNYPGDTVLIEVKISIVSYNGDPGR